MGKDCPNCKSKQAVTEWDSQRKRLIHQCRKCGTCWLGPTLEEVKEQQKKKKS